MPIDFYLSQPEENIRKATIDFAADSLQDVKKIYTKY